MQRGFFTKKEKSRDWECLPTQKAFTVDFSALHYTDYIQITGQVGETGTGTPGNKNKSSIWELERQIAKCKGVSVLQPRVRLLRLTIRVSHHTILTIFVISLQFESSICWQSAPASVQHLSRNVCFDNPLYTR